MSRPGARGLFGATLAIAALAAAIAAPRELGAGSLHVPAAARAGECFASGCEPGPPGLVDRLDFALVERAGALEDLERRLVARTVVTEAEAARIDPLLVLALIGVESSWDPEALSPRGARGLMQLREPTMRRELERSGLFFDDPHDPVANVQAGVRYLRRLLDAFGREEVALMAYNAGPNRILGFLREGEIPPRFHVYPRRVRAELRSLRRSLGRAPAMLVADAGAGAGATRAVE